MIASTIPTTTASTEGTNAMTRQPVELPQALHVALLNCQAAHDARSRAHTAYLDSLVNHAPKATQVRLNQAHHQSEQQADAAFRALGRALDAEGGHDLWRIVYLKGGRTRSRIQVRPTRPSARRNEGLARLALRRRLEAQGATVQYLVALPVGLADQVDGWDRVQGMVRLGVQPYQGKASLGPWQVMAYGQPAPDPVAKDWEGEHRATQGQHYGMNGLDSSAGANCPLCLGRADVEVIVDLGVGGGLAQSHLGTPCLAKYADGWDFACTLPQGHDGQHQDDVTDAPATVAWYDTNAPWNVARQVPPEAAYARSLAAQGRCPTCQALSGNYHQDGCQRQGIVGELSQPAGPQEGFRSDTEYQRRLARLDRPRTGLRTCTACGCQEAPSTTCRHYDALADQPRQDAPCAPRKPQDGREAPDLTGWAPGEITESYGR